MIYDVIVIGAGASGLFAMANLKKGLKAICIEKNSSAGTKLLLTGGGRCNLTSSEDIKEMVKAYEPASFVRKILYGFPNKELIKWFEDRGVKTYREGKKIFPRSDSAKTVLDCLLKEIAKKEYSILYHHNVLKIERKEEYLELSVVEHLSRIDKSQSFDELKESDFKLFKCKKLILATGGKCYASTGSDGKFLEENFDITPFEPSLTPIYIKEALFKDLAGVDIKDVRLISSSKKEFFGDLLFAGRYLSGPVILNFSSSFKLLHHEDLEEQTYKFKIDFLPKFSFDELLAKLQPTDGEKRLFKTLVFEALQLPNRFLEVLLSKHHLMEIKASQLSKKSLRAFVEDLKKMELTVSKKGNFNIAMSSIGGVRVDEINAKNMSLKSDIRIRVLGEALDIGAFTGGYHLQFAFSGAFLAVSDIGI